MRLSKIQINALYAALNALETSIAYREDSNKLDAERKVEEEKAVQTIFTMLRRSRREKERNNQRQGAEGEASRKTYAKQDTQVKTESSKT